jgi:hypothetical protein
MQFFQAYTVLSKIYIFRETQYSPVGMENFLVIIDVLSVSMFPSRNWKKFFDHQCFSVLIQVFPRWNRTIFPLITYVFFCFSTIPQRECKIFPNPHNHQCFGDVVGQLVGMWWISWLGMWWFSWRRSSGLDFSRLPQQEWKNLPIITNGFFLFQYSPAGMEKFTP